MLELIDQAGSFLEPQHERSDPGHYSRNLVYGTPDGSLSLYTDLARGGVILSGRAAVTSFVPNPDQIHMTGVPAERSRAVSLHLYGRMMNAFNIYDVAAGTRRRMELSHNES